MIIYSSYFMIIAIYIYNCYVYLENKYEQYRANSVDLLDAIKIKINILNVHILTILIFILCYILFLLIGNILPDNGYMSQLKFFIYNITDIVMLNIYMIAFRPRSDPVNYNNFFFLHRRNTITRGSMLKTYIANIPETYFEYKTDSYNYDKLNNNEIRDVIEDKDIPIVVINPFDNINNCSLCIGIRNMTYYNHI